MKEILDKYFLVEIVEDSEPDILGWKVVGTLKPGNNFHVRTTKEGWLDVFDIKCLSSGMVVANYPDGADFYIEELKDIISELSQSMYIIELLKDNNIQLTEEDIKEMKTWQYSPYTSTTTTWTDTNINTSTPTWISDTKTSTSPYYYFHRMFPTGDYITTTTATSC